MAEEKQAPQAEGKIDFYAFYRKIPGGSMIIPMLVFAVINTIFPNLWTSLGSVSQATFKTGTLTFVGLILFATGAGISAKTLGETLKRAGVFTLVKIIVIDFGVCLLFLKLFGLPGFLGINAIAFITAMCGCNPGVFAGIIADYGEPEDMGNFAMMNILSMPAFPLMVLAVGDGGSAGFDWLVVVTIFIPLILGFIMGNLDPKLAKLYGATMPIALPFLGACFGSGINLVSAVQSGFGGILLSVIYLVINLAIMIPVDKFINKRPGYAAAAMCSVPGIALSIGAFLGGTPYEVYVQSAVAMLAFSILITNLSAPFITKFVVDLWGSPKVPSKKEREALAAQEGKSK